MNEIVLLLLLAGVFYGWYALKKIAVVNPLELPIPSLDIPLPSPLSYPRFLYSTVHGPCSAAASACIVSTGNSHRPGNVLLNYYEVSCISSNMIPYHNNQSLNMGSYTPSFLSDLKYLHVTEYL